jgi:hypothetical protein
MPTSRCFAPSLLVTLLAAGAAAQATTKPAAPAAKAALPKPAAPAAVPDAAKAPTTLYIQTAAKATVTHLATGEYKIVLSNPSTATTWVADRPTREAGVVPHGERRF